MNDEFALILQKAHANRPRLEKILAREIDSASIDTVGQYLRSKIEDDATICPPQKDIDEMHERILTICNSMYHTLIVTNFSKDDRDIVSEYLLLFLNTGMALEDKNLVQQVEALQKLNTQALSLLDTIDVLKELVKKIEPLLSVSSFETESSRRFTELVNKRLSDTRWQS